MAPAAGPPWCWNQPCFQKADGGPKQGLARRPSPSAVALEPAFGDRLDVLKDRERAGGIKTGSEVSLTGQVIPSPGNVEEHGTPWAPFQLWGEKSKSDFSTCLGKVLIPLLPLHLHPQPHPNLISRSCSGMRLRWPASLAPACEMATGGHSKRRQQGGRGAGPWTGLGAQAGAGGGADQG